MTTVPCLNDRCAGTVEILSGLHAICNDCITIYGPDASSMMVQIMDKLTAPADELRNHNGELDPAYEVQLLRARLNGLVPVVMGLIAEIMFQKRGVEL